MKKLGFIICLFCASLSYSQTANSLQPTCDTSIRIPQIVSPNAHNGNDVFYIKFKGKKPEKFTLKIFNRWGEHMYSICSDDESWEFDPSKGTKKIESGTFYWVLKFNFLGDEEKECTGYFSYIR